MIPFPPDLNRDRLPHHVAVIMDGNGRWAQRLGLPRMAGHHQGARTLKNLVRCCKDWGIAMLTVYAFSTENWRRPWAEVGFLMSLFERLLQQELAEMEAAGVRVQFLGDLAGLPPSLQSEVYRAMATTMHNRAVTLNIAVNYGGRAELVRACRSLAQRVQRGELTPADIDEAAIAHALDTYPDPDPDLLIRTSGEQRLSNYLLWQLAYSELYFTDCPWPDFDQHAFHQALLSYQQRDRRFGQVSASLTHPPRATVPLLFPEAQVGA